ncbi:MAG TPA: DUF2191 domain-containing protein [Rhodocyclaceae bacterium]|nr:DUF2191 domain-containing protein [Rhodocyclaceae bacterium]
MMKHPEFHIPGAMKTTLNLRDDLVAEAKALAARERTTLTKIFEEGLALRLRRQRRADAGNLGVLPVSARRGGFRQGIDATSNRSLLDAADE